MSDRAPSSTLSLSSTAAVDTPGTAGRGGGDRRSRPTRMFSKYLLRGRRKGGRRTGERERIYVDRPGPRILAAFGALMLLSVADACFTLYELTKGGTEANPVMRAALELGNGGFIILKTLVTLLGASFLCLHKNWPLGRKCLVGALLGYVDPHRLAPLRRVHRPPASALTRGRLGTNRTRQRARSPGPIR